ncbi:MAG: DUF502 domain-containing protein [Opitutaceae bacterium]|nr:DUF502 domain-containing protein [Cytophagales bacterium]
MQKPSKIVQLITEITSRKLIRYFLQGILFVGPISITVFIMYKMFMFVDGLIDIDIPGLGMLIVFGSITLLGALASTIFAKPLFDLLENLLNHLPVVKVLYSSLKDFMDAFVGKDKKFTQPVLILTSGESNLHMIGFVTKPDMSEIGLPGMAAVYFPHSYNFSGNVYLVSKEFIKPIAASSTEVMKFVVSGGVAGLH